MTISTNTIDVTEAVEIALTEEYAWCRYVDLTVTLWLKGWIHGTKGDDLLQWFVKNNEILSAEKLGDYLSGKDGHFAIVASGNNWSVAAVDWVRSIPIAAAQVDHHWVIDGQPNRLRQRAKFGTNEVNIDAAREIAMAGYTIDHKSLYRGLWVLAPGELFYFSDAVAPLRHKYHSYQPWRAEQSAKRVTEKELENCTLEIMDRTVASLDGRPLIIPLSAGNDSRLIASAAKHLGVKNVRCFAYGRAGNHEVKTSKAIAERLGYDWRFVPSTITKARQFFSSDAYTRYLDFADSCTSVPFVQDMMALQELKVAGFIPADAIIANGNSGDYISGAHISAELCHPRPDLSAAERKIRILNALYDKHFALWKCLRTEPNKQRILSELELSLNRGGAILGDADYDHGIYEYAEFQDRQCKYVVTGQRIYEFLGHEWRLPLWDNAYLRFWETVPLSDKNKQSLYLRMLKQANWGNVWQDIPVNELNVRPLWVIPLRWIAKAAHASLDRTKWHRFERQYFQYWMDVTCNSACVPYWRVAKDQRGSRQFVSWLTEQYLHQHGIALNGMQQA
jgi:asparagine synthase (glutamine-hydrolysing)